MKDYYISIPENDGKTLSEIETILLKMGYSSDKRWNDWMRDSSFDCVTASKGGKYAIHYHKGEYDHDDIGYTHDQFISEFGEKSATEKMLEMLDRRKYFEYYLVEEYSGELIAAIHAKSGVELSDKLRLALSEHFDLAEEDIVLQGEPIVQERWNPSVQQEIELKEELLGYSILITPIYLY